MKLRGLEDRLNNDPSNIARHLLWLRSEVVVREVISLAKQLNLQPYHPSQMNLRQEDLTRLFGDVLSTQTNTNMYNTVSNQRYPSHCVFFQFSQFEDWYFVIATVKNEFKFWLCCINKSYDQSGIYQAIVDLTYLDCGQLWIGQFGEDSPSLDESKMSNKRHYDDISEEENTLVNDSDSFDLKEAKQEDLKKRRMSSQIPDELNVVHTYKETVDK